MSKINLFRTTQMRGVALWLIVCGFAVTTCFAQPQKSSPMPGLKVTSGEKNPFDTGGFASPAALAGGWEKLPGKAVDIGAGPGGSVWIAGTDTRAYFWNIGKGEWTQVPGDTIIGIDIGPDGKPWVVNQGGSIAQFDPTINNWKIIKGPPAKDIGVGLDGSVFIIGKNSVIQRLNQSTGAWEKYPGLAEKIDVAEDGSPLIVNQAKNVLFWNPSQNNWVETGSALDITVSGKTVLAVGASDFKLCRRPMILDKAPWVKAAMEPGVQFQRLSAAPDGSVWAVASDNSIWHYSDDLPPFKGGATIRLKAPNGKYWSVNNPNWELKANCDKPGFWETFTITSIDNSPKKVCLQTPDGKFLSIRLDPVLRGGDPYPKDMGEIDVSFPPNSKGLLTLSTENNGKKALVGDFAYEVVQPLPKPAFDTFLAANGLTVGYVKEYDRVWSSKNQAAGKPVITIGRPKLPDGWVFLGDVIGQGDKDPTTPSLIVQDNPQVLARPVGYYVVWDDSRVPGSSFPGGSERAAIVHPIPPAGFVSLGSVVCSGNHGLKAGERVIGRTLPQLEQFRCVPTNTVMTGDWAPEVWNSDAAGTIKGVGLVGTLPASAGSRGWDIYTGGAPAIPPGTFKSIARDSQTAYFVHADKAGGGYFKDFAPPGMVVVGLGVRQGDWIDGIRGLFGDPNVPGHVDAVSSLYRGRQDGGERIVWARPGYALGNISIAPGNIIDGLEIIFMKFYQGRLNSNDQYGHGVAECRFIPDRDNGRWTTYAHRDADLDVIAGIRGFSGSNLDGLGLVEGKDIPYMIKGLTPDQLKEEMRTRALAEARLKEGDFVANKLKQELGNYVVAPPKESSLMQDVKATFAEARSSGTTVLTSTPVKDVFVAPVPVKPASLPPITKPLGEFKSAITALENAVPEPDALVAHPGGAILKTNQFLLANEYLRSANGKYFALMAPNGVLNVYPGPMWRSGSGTPPRDNEVNPSFAYMEGDGKVVVCIGANPRQNKGLRWKSNNPLPKGDYCLVIQDDGKLCIYAGKDPGDPNKNPPKWESTVDPKIVKAIDDKKTADLYPESLKQLLSQDASTTANAPAKAPAAQTPPPALKITSVPGFENVDFLKNVVASGAAVSSGNEPCPWVCMSGDASIKFPAMDVAGSIQGSFFAFSRHKPEGLNSGFLFFPSSTTSKTGMLAGEPFQTLGLSEYVITYAPRLFSCDYNDLPPGIQTQFKASTKIDSGKIIFGETAGFAVGLRPQNTPWLKDLLGKFLNSVDTMVLNVTRPRVPTDPTRVRASIRSGFKTNYFPPGFTITEPEIEFNGLQMAIIGKVSLRISDSFQFSDLELRIDYPKLELGKTAPNLTLTITATIPGDWQNPLGIKGLTLRKMKLIGQVGQLPSIGVGGEIDFGKILAVYGGLGPNPPFISYFSTELAANQSGDKSLSLKEIILGVNNLIRQGASTINLPDPGTLNIPIDIIRLDDVKVAFAQNAVPSVPIDRGMTVRGKLNIGGSDIGAVDMRIVDKGFKAQASVAKFKLGPVLELSGAGPDGKRGTSDDCPYLDIQYFVDTGAKPLPIMTGSAAISGYVKIADTFSLDVLLNLEKEVCKVSLIGKLGGGVGIGLAGSVPMNKGFSPSAIDQANLSGYVEIPGLGKLGGSVTDLVKNFSVNVPVLGNVSGKDILCFLPVNMVGIEEISLNGSLGQIAQGTIPGINVKVRVGNKTLPNIPLPPLPVKDFSVNLATQIAPKVWEEIKGFANKIGGFFNDAAAETAKFATAQANAAKDLSINVGNQIANTGVLIGNTFKNLGNAVGDEATRLGTEVGAGFIYVGDKVKNGIGKAGDWLKDNLNPLKWF